VPRRNSHPLNRELPGTTDKVVVGAAVGIAVGTAEGLAVGSRVGLFEGNRDGFAEGILVGFVVVVGEEEKEGAGTGVGALLASVGVEVG
jgi:hypothetical protein